MPRKSTSPSAPKASVAPPAGPDAGETAAEPPQRLSVDTVDDGGDWSGVGDVAALVREAAAALADTAEISHLLPATACLALSTDAAVRALNAHWRAQDKATNVLSFPSDAPTPPGEAVFLGDIILADGVVAREADEAGLPPAHHFQHLVIHGLLHLMGYDHDTDADAGEMEGLETRILATLGIADPYSAID